MFDAVLGKVLENKTVEWKCPKYLTVRNNDEVRDYEILKGAENYLHKKLDVKPATSKEVYKKDEGLWRQLRDIQFDKISNPEDKANYFALNKENVMYIVADDQLIDVYDARTPDNAKDLKERLEKFILDITTTETTKKFFTDGQGGMVKLICYDKEADLPNEEYTPVVILEMNSVKSVYTVYTGILVFSTFTFIPNSNPILSCDSYASFIYGVDISKALEMANENASYLYDTYLTFKSSPVEISARELVAVLKKVGYKLEVAPDDQLDTIEAITDTENNIKIQNYFNTFKDITGETAFEILALSDIKKVFRYNKLTILDTLEILSKEYLAYEGSKITVDVLLGIILSLYQKHSDKGQIEALKKEMEQ